jgi:hypothetical protein
MLNCHCTSNQKKLFWQLIVLFFVLMSFWITVVTIVTNSSNVIVVLCEQQSPSYQAERCTAFCCDVTVDDLSATVPAESCDLATLVFVLSAISPHKMVDALRNIARVQNLMSVLLSVFGKHFFV